MPSFGYTHRCRDYLDVRYRLGVAEGRYLAHQPIYGLADLEATEPGPASAAFRYARIFHVLRWIHRLKPASLLDVGCGEGYIAALAARTVAASGGRLEAVGVDVSIEAARRTVELHGVPACAADADRLPFADASFDVVMLSEVIEHLEFPVESILEAMRVARRAVLITTQEFCTSALRRFLHMASANRCENHGERNYWVEADFREIADGWRRAFGDAWRLRFVSQGAMATARECALARDAAAAREQIRGIVDDPTAGRDPFGFIVVLERADADAASTEDTTDDPILDALLAPSTPLPNEPAEAAPAEATETLIARFVSPATLVPLAPKPADGNAAATLTGSGGEEFTVDPLGIGDFCACTTTGGGTAPRHAETLSRAGLAKLASMFGRRRSWGGWRTHFASIALHAVEAGTGGLARLLPRAASATVRALVPPGDAAIHFSVVHFSEGSPDADHSLDGRIHWKWSVDRWGGARGVALEISDPGAHLATGPLLDDSVSRLYERGEYHVDTVRAIRDNFRHAGRYELRLHLVGRFGKLLGRSPVVVLTIDGDA